MQRLRLAQIALRSYHPKFITDAVADIRRSATQMGIDMSGTIPLPTKKRKYTVQKATFVYKSARSQYQHDTHKRLIEFYGDSSTGQAATNVVHFLRYLEHTILAVHPGCTARVTLFSDERIRDR
jgi:small subunit ribosomal protein S10